MTRETVPSFVRVTCDACKQVCTAKTYSLFGALKFARGEAYSGDDMPCNGIRDATYTLDLCDECNWLMNEAIQEELERISSNTAKGSERK